MRTADHITQEEPTEKRLKSVQQSAFKKTISGWRASQLQFLAMLFAFGLFALLVVTSIVVLILHGFRVGGFSLKSGTVEYLVLILAANVGTMVILVLRYIFKQPPS